jgi:hypothetical protein
MYILKSLNAHCKVQTYPMSLEIQTVNGGAVGILLNNIPTAPPFTVCISKLIGYV